MALKVAFDEQRGVIRGVIEGVLDKQSVTDYYQELNTVMAQTGCFYVLTDLRKAEISLTKEDIQFVGEVMVKRGIDNTIKRAILSEDAIKMLKEWVYYLFGHGYRDVRLFINEDAALAWLDELKKG